MKTICHCLSARAGPLAIRPSGYLLLFGCSVVAPSGCALPLPPQALCSYRDHASFFSAPMPLYLFCHLVGMLLLYSQQSCFLTVFKCHLPWALCTTYSSLLCLLQASAYFISRASSCIFPVLNIKTMKVGISWALKNLTDKWLSKWIKKKKSTSRSSWRFSGKRHLRRISKMNYVDIAEDGKMRVWEERGLL